MRSVPTSLATSAVETSTFTGGPKQTLTRGDLLLALLTAVSLVLVLIVYSTVNHARITDFITIGHVFGDRLGLGSLAVLRIGYDGQFYYFMARFSGHLPAGAVDFPALRYSRILYPVVVRVLSLGNLDAIPWVMLAVNVAAIAATVAMLSWLLRQLGGQQWTALVIGFYCGQPLALLRDVSDPLAVCFIALALVGLIQRRWLLTAAALGLGMLTRESTLLFVACFALPLVLARQWRMLALYGLVALAPYAVWQGMLKLWLGSWGWQQTTHINTFVPIPFAGLTGAHYPLVAALMFVYAGIPALVAIAAGTLLLLRSPWTNPIAVATATSAVVYGIALILQPSIHWQDIWEPFRLAAPLILLLPILSTLLKPGRIWQRRWNLFHASLAYTFLFVVAVTVV
jgi:hypothetical protein